MAIQMIGDKKQNGGGMSLSFPQAAAMISDQFNKNLNNLLQLNMLKRMCTQEEAKKMLQDTFDQCMLALDHFPLYTQIQMQDVTFGIELKKVLQNQFNMLCRYVDAMYVPITSGTEAPSSPSETTVYAEKDGDDNAKIDDEQQPPAES